MTDAEQADGVGEGRQLARRVATDVLDVDAMAANRLGGVLILLVEPGVDRGV
ncbi:hypothetical protein [Microbacterium sp.]|uniref:hypothetical protein n=1 Tax=Microbacterium sp. TaxID=51671 RepID=UPI0025F756EF|nr:hypothetical protein [Microbacterium sp.]